MAYVITAILAIIVAFSSGVASPELATKISWMALLSGLFMSYMNKQQFEGQNLNINYLVFMMFSAFLFTRSGMMLANADVNTAVILSMAGLYIMGRAFPKKEPEQAPTK